MVLSVDEYLEYVGVMGRFQWLIVVLVGIMMIPVTFQTLIMTFLALEPEWKCVVNSTICNFTRKFLFSIQSYRILFCIECIVCYNKV